MHQEETYNLLKHLWTFQPTYVEFSSEQMFNQVLKEYTGPQGVDVGELSSFSEMREKSQANGRWSEFQSTLHPAQEYEKHDLSLTQKVLSEAEQVRSIQAETSAKLLSQAGLYSPPLFSFCSFFAAHIL